MKNPVLKENARILMRQLGDDQSSFADRLGVSQGTVSRIGASIPGGTALSAMAKLAGTTPEKLLTEKLADRPPGTRSVRVVGFVGAGEAVYAFENLGLNDEQPMVDVPADITGNAALTVKGASLYPQAEEGWSVIYVGGRTTEPREAIGHLCVVQLEDGRMLVKKVEAGTKRGTYTLLSSNAPPMENMPLLWVARVQAIIPT